MDKPQETLSPDEIRLRFIRVFGREMTPAEQQGFFSPRDQSRMRKGNGAENADKGSSFTWTWAGVE
jgi:hypothetical protein